MSEALGNRAKFPTLGKLSASPFINILEHIKKALNLVSLVSPHYKKALNLSFLKL